MISYWILKKVTKKAIQNWISLLLWLMKKSMTKIRSRIEKYWVRSTMKIWCSNFDPFLLIIIVCSGINLTFYVFCKYLYFYKLLCKPQTNYFLSFFGILKLFNKNYNKSNKLPKKLTNTVKRKSLNLKI